MRSVRRASGFVKTPIWRLTRAACFGRRFATDRYLSRIGNLAKEEGGLTQFASEVARSMSAVFWF
jgi:hypothetical protein